MSDYEIVYRQQKDFFGAGEDPMLELFENLVPPGGKILDIGVGQGRIALPLARKGFAITGIDTSEAAIEVTRQSLTAEKCTAVLWQGSFEEYDPGCQFDAVLAFGLLPELSRSKGDDLCRRAREWCREGGLIVLRAWQVQDPAFHFYQTTGEHIGKNSFRLPNGRIRTYFDRNEILTQFPGWEVIHHWEGLGPEHQHGDGKREQHAYVEFVARKPSLVPQG